MSTTLISVLIIFALNELAYVYVSGWGNVYSRMICLFSIIFVVGFRQKRVYGDLGDWLRPLSGTARTTEASEMLGFERKVITIKTDEFETLKCLVRNVSESLYSQSFGARSIKNDIGAALGDLVALTDHLAEFMKNRHNVPLRSKNAAQLNELVESLNERLGDILIEIEQHEDKIPQTQDIFLDIVNIINIGESVVVEANDSQN